jgi:endonuclease/exonuclease/phosphatase (EEP) superfamily protein YafD
MDLLMKRTFWERLGTTTLDLAVMGLALASLLPFAGRLHWRIDLFSHFRAQYLLGLGVLVLFYLLNRNWRRAVAGLVFAILNASLIYPLYLPQISGRPFAAGQTYRLLIANVNITNRSFGALRSLTLETEPDFVLLMEIDRAWVEGLSLRELGYAQSVVQPQTNNFGIGLFSRHPLEAAEILVDPAGRTIGVRARALLDCGSLELIGVHPPPPIIAVVSARRDEQIRTAFELATAIEGTAILAGDFNATTWSYALAEPLAKSGLRDSRAGFGTQATWPAFYPAFLRIPIDHVFISNHLQVLERVVGPNIGSDHLPLWIDFEIPEESRPQIPQISNISRAACSPCPCQLSTVGTRNCAACCISEREEATRPRMEAR